MKKFSRKQIATGAVALTMAGTLFASSLAMGASTDTELPAWPEDKLTMAEWAEQYPLQYGSFAQLKEKDWTPGYEGHYSLGLKLLAPISRDGNTILLDENGAMAVDMLEYDEETGRWYACEGGQYDPLNNRTTDLVGCYSCKTSYFEDILPVYGESLAVEPTSAEFLDAVNGQIWDCYLCHTDDPTAGVDNHQTLFKELMGDAYDELTPEDRVCGQCHSHSVHNTMFKSGIAWADYGSFDYGFDADSVLQAEKEAGFGSYEESTGITTYRSSHAELEITLDSNHHALGVTCVDCHMPQITDPETGETFTDHDASQSPLENEASLAYCLTCHEAQGIDSPEAMVQMVKDLQAETADRGEALKAKLADLHDLIEDANQGGTMDEETLNQARDMYTQATFYMEWGTFGNGSAYVKVVHNPEEIQSLQQRADVVLDEAIALFA